MKDGILSAPEIIASFRAHLLADGKAETTIESYVCDVSGFVEWLNGRGVSFLGDIQRMHVTGFRSWLIQEGLETATVNKKINSLKSLNQFLLDAGFALQQAVDTAKDKLKVANGSEKEVEVLADDDVERLLFHVANRVKVSARDALIVNLLLYSGIRVSELVSIRLRDVDLITGTLFVKNGKGSKSREIPLRGEVVDCMRDYISGERSLSKFKESELLLLTQRTGKMDRDTVNKILSALGRQTGLSLHPHLFRHTFCNRLVKRGVELTTVAKLAGHSGITTTATYYVNTSRKDKRDAVDLF